MYQVLSHFSGFLHHFELAKLATSSLSVKTIPNWLLLSGSLYRNNMAKGAMYLYYLLGQLPSLSFSYLVRQIFREKISKKSNLGLNFSLFTT